MPASRAGGGSVRRSHRAIAGEVSVKDRKLLKRPRVIFSTSLIHRVIAGLGTPARLRCVGRVVAPR